MKVRAQDDMHKVVVIWFHFGLASAEASDLKGNLRCDAMTIIQLLSIFIDELLKIDYR